MAVAGRSVLRRLPHVGPPRRRARWSASPNADPTPPPPCSSPMPSARVVDDEELLGAVPVRYRGDVVALLTQRRRRPADVVAAGNGLPGLRRTPAGHGVGRDLPECRRSGAVAVQPAGRRQVHPPDVDGVATYASPNALSAYHRMGLTAELEGHNLIAITGRCCPTRSRREPTTSAPRWPVGRACAWELDAGARRCCCAPCRSASAESRPALPC